LKAHFYTLYTAISQLDFFKTERFTEI